MHARWIGGASGPAVDTRFLGVHRRGPVVRLNRLPVVVADRPRELPLWWATGPFGDITRWTYGISPGDEPDTATVEGRFELRRDQPPIARAVMTTFLRATDRRADLEANVRVSPERLRDVIDGR